jgi:DNA-directed RNA polymerase specialized sigma24 family protein
MDSVALSTPASASALRADSELVRKAAGGDAESFGELYRRHCHPAWRLAQAAAANNEDAVQAVGEGFASALKPRRGRRHAGGSASGFRTLLLASVYQAAVGRNHADSTAPATVPMPRRAKAGRAGACDAILVDAAFRSLPDRWRGAVWLSEVEGFGPDRIAPILGVSLPVATQLTTRGGRGLAGRFAQARRPVPDQLGSALDEIADVLPANLAAVAESHWLERDHRAGLDELSAWLSERAVRPLWAAVGGLTGLGLIGLGLVGQGAIVSTASGSGPNSSAKTLPVGSSTVPCFVDCPVTAAGFGTNGLVFLPGSAGGTGSSGTGHATDPGVSGSGTSDPAGSAGGSLGASTNPSSGTGSSGTGSSGTGSSGSGSSGSSTGGSSGSGSSGGSGGSGSQQQSKTVIDVGSVASVTQTGNTVQANVLPTSSGSSTASVRVGCSTLVGVTVGSITLGCPAAASTPTTTAAATSSTTSTTTTAPTTTTTLPLLGIVGKLLSGL